MIFKVFSEFVSNIVSVYVLGGSFFDHVCMWDLSSPDSGINPPFPALEDNILTTGLS